MNKVLPVFIAAYSLAVGAQSAEPQVTDKERQRMVDAATLDVGPALPSDPQWAMKQRMVAAVTQDIGYTRRAAAQQERNVAASKKMSSMSAPDKNQFFMDINTRMVNPENPSGVFGMAEMQKVNVEASQGKPPQAVNLPIAAYQAYSSDSHQFKLPPDANMPAFATAYGTTVANQAATPTRPAEIGPVEPAMSSRSN